MAYSPYYSGQQMPPYPTRPEPYGVGIQPPMPPPPPQYAAPPTYPPAPAPQPYPSAPSHPQPYQQAYQTPGAQAYPAPYNAYSEQQMPPPPAPPSPQPGYHHQQQQVQQLYQSTGLYPSPQPVQQMYQAPPSLPPPASPYYQQPQPAYGTTAPPTAHVHAPPAGQCYSGPSDSSLQQLPQYTKSTNNGGGYYGAHAQQYNSSEGGQAMYASEQIYAVGHDRGDQREIAHAMQYATSADGRVVASAAETCATETQPNYRQGYNPVPKPRPQPRGATAGSAERIGAVTAEENMSESALYYHEEEVTTTRSVKVIKNSTEASSNNAAVMMAAGHTELNDDAAPTSRPASRPASLSAGSSSTLAICAAGASPSADSDPARWVIATRECRMWSQPASLKPSTKIAHLYPGALLRILDDTQKVGRDGFVYRMVESGGFGEAHTRVIKVGWVSVDCLCAATEYASQWANCMVVDNKQEGAEGMYSEPNNKSKRMATFPHGTVVLVLTDVAPQMGKSVWRGAKGVYMHNAVKGLLAVQGTTVGWVNQKALVAID